MDVFRRRTGLGIVLALILLVSMVVPMSSAQYSSISLTVKVYDDGSAAVTQLISASPNDTSILVHLLSPIISDATASDGIGSPLSFQISGSNMTIYTLGTTSLVLDYDTLVLTSKQGAIWTLTFSTPYNTTVVLPDMSSVTQVSGTPISFLVQSGYPTLTLGPGSWSITYGVPIQAASTTSSTSTSTTSSAGGSTGTGTSTTGVSSANSSASSRTSASPAPQPAMSYWPYLLIIVAALLLLVGLFLRRRRTSTAGLASAELRPDDIQVLDFIAEKGGKVLEPEIRMRFALPKTSGWRQIKRLERLGYVKVTKIGSQNQIELLKNRDGKSG